MLFQRIKKPADVVVQLLNRITVVPPFGFALERFADADRVVQHGVRQVEEERTLFVLADKLDGFIGVQACELRGIGRALEHLAIPDQRHAALFLKINDLHRIQIVAQAEVVVESLVAWQKRFVKAKVPFADASRGVAIGLE